MTPELTIRVPCPTCGGTGEMAIIPGTWVWTDAGMKLYQPKCPDCTDGTIRREVSCQTCKWNDDGECMKLCVATTGLTLNVEFLRIIGCKKWEQE